MADRIEVDLIVKALSQGFDKLDKETQGLANAMDKLIQKEKQSAQMKSAKEALAGMSQQQKDAFQSALQLSKAQSQLAQSQEQARFTTKGLGLTLTDLKSGLDLALGAAKTFAQILETTFNVAKEGAQLEFTAQRFERLAEGIGTTSTALMTDLRMATRGMIDDSQLMGSAADLISLGLAKTHNEAVRLARVAAGLNMNMNQLVLTLTNQTTMRFDALGVAVDGFEEKVKALEQTGLSAEEAFREAFLQQAEEQLKRVGEAADSAVGPYQRLEAAVKNQTDAFKRQVSEALAPLVGLFADVMEGHTMLRTEIQASAYDLKESAKSWDEYAESVMEGIRQSGYFTKVVDDRIRVFQREGSVTVDITDKFDLLARSEWEAAQAADEVGKKSAMSVSQIHEMRAATEAAHGAGRNWADMLYEQGDALDEMRKQAEEAGKAARSLKITFAEMTEQRLADTLLADITKAYQEGLISAEEYRAMSAEVAHTIGGIPLEQINASTALFTLQQDYLTGKITLEEYITAVQRFNEELNGIPSTISVLIDLKVRGDEALAYLKGGGIYAGTPAPNPATNTGQSRTSRPGGYIPGFQTGGSFVVPPGYPNDSFVMRVSSGEHVQVTPAGKSGGGGGGVYIENLIISGADSPEATGHAVVSRLRKTQARSGMGDYGGR